MDPNGTNGNQRQPAAFWSGGWSVEPSRNLLLRDGEQVRLEPRVMDALVCLAGRAGEVVSKEELVERVWQGRFVTDDVLTVTIYALRKALGDDARQPRYIETVPRRGYRWIAPVVRQEGAKPEPLLEPAPAGASVQPEVPQPRRIAWERPAAAALALALLAAGAAWMLTLPERGRRAASAEAHEANVKGRFFLDLRSPQGVHQAHEQFQRVVSLEPRDPAGHAGLADTYTAMSDFGLASPAEMRPKAMQAAERALQLDPQSAEAHAALGRALFLFDWNFPAAERSLGRALALDPDFAPAHQTLAWLKSAQGRHAEAAAAARRALQLDPVNTARYRELAWVLVLGGKHEQALRETERGLLLDPRSFDTHITKGWVHEMAGRPDAAFAAYREALRIAGAPEATLRHVETVYRAEGLGGYYRDWLDRQQRRGDLPACETWRAHLYVRTGQHELAIESLEHAYQKREGALAWVNVEPSFQPLRSDARFREIAAQVGHQ